MKLCEVCLIREAKYVCKMCSRHVCERHYVADAKLCALCAETLCAICGRNLATASCPICGRLTCSECLVQITPVHRVCKVCAQTIPKEVEPPLLTPKAVEELERLSAFTRRVLAEIRKHFSEVSSGYHRMRETR